MAFLMSMSTATAIFSSSHALKGTLDADTSVFFLGKTSISGNSTGYPMERIINSTIVQNMNAFPLIGKSTITNIDSLLVAEDIDLTRASSLEELYLRYANHITEYSNVEVTTENGLFLLGIDDGTMSVSTEVPYAVTTFLPFDLSPGSTTRLFLTASMIPITMHCTGNYAVLTGESNTSMIRVIDAHGAVLWTGTSENTYLLIQKKTFDVTQQPPLFFFPLRNTLSASTLTLTISPAATQDIALTQLIKNVTSMVQHLGYTPSEFIQNIDILTNFIQTSSLVTNGAMLLLQTNDTLTIDHTAQHFSATGFARFTSLSVSSTGSSSGPVIQGDSSLIFLGNHFYNPQAKRSPNGIVFPYELLFLWGIAIGVFVAVHLFIRPDVDEGRDNKVKRYALVFHVVLIIIAFLVVDLEVNGFFGISAGTALFTQGFTMITAAFIFVEIIVWVIGYVLLALPMQLLVNSGLRFLGIGKGGKGIGKGLGDIFIWVFTSFYLLLILNFVLLFFNLNAFVPIG
jgi:hypothetical protein